MKLTRLSATLGLTVLATAALAMPAFIKDLETNYKLGKDSAILKAKCDACHVTKSIKLNTYGQDLKKIMAELKTKKLTAEVFKKSDDLDSDKDEAKNIDEIKADTLPGDPKSTPKKGGEKKE
jgi:hypothetical protein